MTLGCHARSKSLVMGEQSRSPGRPPCPRRLGPVLKAGWLKKQRSIMKNWQQRWFVLPTSNLILTSGTLVSEASASQGLLLFSTNIVSSTFSPRLH
uniref:PH domain-containing protein n=1 Tax=Sus scrofa TaxID=9823 RepID=A0A8D0YM05_PIG